MIYNTETNKLQYYTGAYHSRKKVREIITINRHCGACIARDRTSSVRVQPPPSSHCKVKMFSIYRERKITKTFQWYIVCIVPIRKWTPLDN